MKRKYVSTGRQGFAPILIFFVVLAAIVGVFILSPAIQNKFKNTNQQTSNSINPTAQVSYMGPSPSSSLSPTPSPVALPVILKSSEITWINPVSVAYLGVFRSQKEIDTLFADSYGGPPDVSKFYFVKVADLADGSILVRAYLPRQNYYGINYINFEVKGGSVKAVLDDIGYPKDLAANLISPNIPIIYGKIDGLNIPETISVNGIAFYNPNVTYPSFEDFNKLKSPLNFGTSNSETMYVTYSNIVAPTPLFDRIFYLKLNDGLVVRYSIGKSSPGYDNNVQKFTWNDKTTNSIAFMGSPFWGGCGGGTASSVQLIKGSDLDALQKEVVGKDVNGNYVYKLIDSASPILKKEYDQYSGSHSGDSSKSVKSYNDFLQDNNNILIKDSIGDWVFYIKPDYGNPAECGKPVIYLYPTQKENVNIKVGAIITKSEPVYPLTGWNVVADPSGKIFVNTINYPYLFWEGKGIGIYPLINMGKVVKKDDLKNQLQKDLYKQGLTEKEVGDFMEFWLPKMPSTPFVRLTWLNTFEMNNLAPLSISPKPDTLIRVFLDFKGLNQPESLIPQDLKTPIRRGFTVVEWGGLLN